MSVRDLLEQGGSVLDNGSAYLVGSLAQGFGNRGSDVDIHLLSPDVKSPTPPYLFFVKGVTVDVEHFPELLPDQISARLDERWLELSGGGRIALESVLHKWEAACATRWLTALPLRDGDPAVFGEREKVAVLAQLARRTLTAVLANWAIAEIVSRSGRGAAHMWRMTGRAVLNLACALRGYPPIGYKWLPARAVRAEVPPDFIGATVDCVAGADVRRILGVLGLADFDIFDVIEIKNAADLTDIRVGAQKFVLTSRGRLETVRPAGGSCGELIDDLGADRLVYLLERGLSEIAVDEAVLTEMLVANREAR